MYTYVQYPPTFGSPTPLEPEEVGMADVLRHDANGINIAPRIIDAESETARSLQSTTQVTRLLGWVPNPNPHLLYPLYDHAPQLPQHRLDR